LEIGDRLVGLGPDRPIGFADVVAAPIRKSDTALPTLPGTMPGCGGGAIKRAAIHPLLD
jgi:hypothetical protein